MRVRALGPVAADALLWRYRGGLVVTVAIKATFAFVPDDAVREICKLDPQARILMCSAMGQQALVVEAIQAGAKDFVVKPFQPSRVLEAVQRVLG